MMKQQISLLFYFDFHTDLINNIGIKVKEVFIREKSNEINSKKRKKICKKQ